MIDARKHVAAFVTIGQSPRDDMVDEIVSIIDRDGFSLPPGAFVQYGALDLVDEAGVADLFPRRGERLLVTRLKTGATVKVSEDRLEPYVRRAVSAATREAGLIVLLCTGSFSCIEASVPILYPDRVLVSYCFSVLTRGTLGVIIPDAGQVEQRRAVWTAAADKAAAEVDILVSSASPYRKEQGRQCEYPEIVSAATELANCDLIVLDCMGYTLEMKRIVRRHSSKPTALARSVVARAVAELL